MKSKLPNVGTNIFTIMSMMANEFEAVNLSQGFPGFDCPEFLSKKAQEYIASGFNQYSPMTGIPSLIEAIIELTQKTANRQITADHVTVTSGATEAIFVAISTIVEAGDEVIIFDPAYDSYEPVVNLNGGICRHVTLNAPDYKIDWQAVNDTINENTKAIILNSPHNPTGMVLSEDDINQLKEIVAKYPLMLISDEVYEHITFDGKKHLSLLNYDEFFERTFVASSFGKSFHITGWKIGYCIAPINLTTEFRKIHQYSTFCSPTPLQFAIAEMMNRYPEHIEQLSSFYQKKRDFMIDHLSESQFSCLPCSGTYFLLLDYSKISQDDDVTFSEWLTKEKGIATIPLSPFFQTPPKETIVRVCFAKDECVLKQACEKLVNI